MRRNAGCLVAALLLAGTPLLAAGEEVTLKGEVVEVRPTKITVVK